MSTEYAGCMLKAARVQQLADYHDFHLDSMRDPISVEHEK